VEACISGQLRGMPKGALSPGVEGGRGSRSNYPHDPASSSLRRNPPHETDLLGTSPLGPWVPLEAAPAALGPSRAPWGIPDGRGGHILAFVFLSIATARGGQTGADHFSSKPRLVLPTVPPIGRGGRRNAFNLHERAIGGPLTRNKQTLAPNRQKFAYCGSTEPRLPVRAV
jgi:hypothetical protein